MDYKPVEDVQIIDHSRQSVQPVTHSTIENVSHNETVVNSSSTEVPMKQARPRPESKDENVSSSNRAEMIQGQRIVEKNLEQFCMSNTSRETVKAEEPHALNYHFATS